MGHDHGSEHRQVSDQGLLWAVVINLGLSVFEFLAGVLAGSVALMADALHNTNDAAALLIAYIARKISRRDANKHFTFGFGRAELIGAMIQLTALIVVGLYLVYEAIHRFIFPQPIEGSWVMAAAGIALIVDIITAWLLWAMSKGSMNVRAAFVHNLTDALASVAVLAGGAAIYWLGWTWVDPALTLIIAGYILYLSVGMLKRTSSILMEGKPKDFDIDELAKAVEATPGIAGIHHVHVWELNEDQLAMEAHVVIQDEAMSRYEEVRALLKQRLHDEFHIEHSTLEFELASNACQAEAGKMIPRHG